MNRVILITFVFYLLVLCEILRQLACSLLRCYFDINRYLKIAIFNVANIF